MTYDGTEALDSEAVAVGPQEEDGPAGVPDAVPARPHRLMVLAGAPRTDKVRGIGSARGERHPARLVEPAHPGPAGTRAKEVPMA
jgi:hypothetical protein